MASPPGLDDHNVVPAHALAGLLGAGGAVALVVTFIPHGMQMSQAITALNELIGTAGLIAALVTWLAGRRFPDWALHPLLIGATTVVSVAAATCDSGPLGIASASFYVALPLFAFRFFTRPVGVGYLAAAGVALGLVLSITGENAAVAEWLLIMTTATAVGVVVSRMRVQLWRLATTDRLTGLPNRHGIDDHLTRRIDQARRRGWDLSVALVDLDGFKSVNDRHGHSAGDEVLAGIADRWRVALRTGDLMGRYGGDEFVVVFPRTDATVAATIVDRLSNEGRNHPFSAGLAALEASDTASSLLDRADRAMYETKRARSISEQASVGVAPPACSCHTLGDETSKVLLSRSSVRPAPSPRGL
ncbi:MAG: GGDEF domain-containing protein [Actinomycetota bacterium]|nr:GGDEF domain-containing protein [Actinomycetota bacterium]